MRFTSLFTATMVALLSLSGCSNAKEKAPDTGNLTATAPAGEASNLTERNAQQRLKTTLEQHFKTAGLTVKIVDLQKVANSPFYWVRLDNHSSVFSTEDGQYVFQGELMKMGDKQLVSIGEQFQSNINKALLAELKTEDLIVYPAKDKTKHSIYVFTDVSCSFCQRLHQNMSEMNARGIEVRYVAWPRGEQLFPAMEQIWCSADRKQAFDATMKGETLTNVEMKDSCKGLVKSQFDLGMKMGVSGTPAIFTTEGKQIGGYLGVDELEKALSTK